MCKLVRHLMVGHKASTQWKSDLLYISSCIKHHACFKHLSKSSSLAVWWEFKKISFKSSLITCKNPFEKSRYASDIEKTELHYKGIKRKSISCYPGFGDAWWCKGTRLDVLACFLTCSFGGCGRGWGCSTRFCQVGFSGTSGPVLAPSVESLLLHDKCTYTYIYLFVCLFSSSLSVQLAAPCVLFFCSILFFIFPHCFPI